MVTYVVLVSTPLRQLVVGAVAVEVLDNLVCGTVCRVYTVLEVVVTLVLLVC
jgi:hypothetical protein